ncbi:hypothetical protein F4808DRAFT_429443 [Astrocystis sublimbata]|nr:hypothetical protein F4808DRAFT_429443 [Astrocystis sublimbata]
MMATTAVAVVTFFKWDWVESRTCFGAGVRVWSQTPPSFECDDNEALTLRYLARPRYGTGIINMSHGAHYPTQSQYCMPGIVFWVVRCRIAGREALPTTTSHNSPRTTMPHLVNRSIGEKLGTLAYSSIKERQVVSSVSSRQ